MSNCRYCNRLAAHVKTLEAWEAEHAEHGGYTTEPFAHPSGNWFWLVCKCGAKYLNIREESHEDGQ